MKTEGVGERVRPERQEGRVKRMIDPRRPTEQEVEDHNRTHLPYRNWCPHCVQARGKDLDHRKSIEEERGLAEFSFDYCFPGDELGYKLTILVGRERTTGMMMATVVPAKGSKGKFTADKVLDYLAECGNQFGDIIVKTDQEPAIKCLVKDLVLERGEELGSKTIVEESPVGSKGSNGLAERAVQEVEGQLRVMKLALEGRIGKEIDAEACVVTLWPSMRHSSSTGYWSAKTEKRRTKEIRAKRQQYWAWSSWKGVVQRKGESKNGQDRCTVELRHLRRRAGQKWRAVDCDCWGGGESTVSAAHSDRRSLVRRLREVGQKCPVAPEKGPTGC